MKRFLSLFTTVLLSLAVWAQHTIVVKAGDVQSLLDAIEEANKVNADKNAERLFILIPDGLYDLGKRVLTRVTGHRVSFIGQSMEGTIIQMLLTSRMRVSARRVSCRIVEQVIIIRT